MKDPKTSKPPRECVDIRRASRLLKCDAFTVYRAIWSKRLRAYKRHGAWRIPLRGLQAFMAKRGKAPNRALRRTALSHLPDREVLPKATA